MSLLPVRLLPLATLLAISGVASAQDKPAARIPAVEVVATKVPEAPHNVPASY